MVVGDISVQNAKHGYKTTVVEYEVRIREETSLQSSQRQPRKGIERTCQLIVLHIAVTN